MSNLCDLFIIGGGINGTAIARAAATAGLDVVLVEQGDLSCGTSSTSTKLIHGGLRYLEQGQFGLVRESLSERALLLRAAPHIVEPLQFHLPRTPGSRPWIVLRAGLWLYDLLAFGGSLPVSRTTPLDTGRALSYWDARVDDSRLVVLNAVDAAEQGARILTRTRFTGGRWERGRWRFSFENANGHEEQIEARAVINAAGPWVGTVLDQVTGSGREVRPRLVRGSHIVLRHQLPDEGARLQQLVDGRIIFLIPFERGLTLVGTTDIAVTSPSATEPDQNEIAYLLDAANACLSRSMSTEDIVWSFGGIRALHDDGAIRPSEVTRDYHFEIEQQRMLLSVCGGKITTARKLAERALAGLGLPTGKTKHRPLPGGDIPSLAGLFEKVRGRWPFLGEERSKRLARAYGSRIWTLMRAVNSEDDLGVDFGHGLTEREVRYLYNTEWARRAEDVLWRRSKLGLLFSDEQTRILDDYLLGLAS